MLKQAPLALWQLRAKAATEGSNLQRQYYTSIGDKYEIFNYISIVPSRIFEYSTCIQDYSILYHFDNRRFNICGVSREISVNV